MIFRLGKTKIKLSFSFVALTVIMILVCNEEIVLCSFLASFIHECGHLFFMSVSDEKVRKIEMTLFGMRINRIDKSCISYKSEILIALGGIIFNYISAALFYVMFKLYGNSVLLIISTVNIIVAVVNSFPVSALDLGRAIRYTLKYKELNESYFSIISYAFTLIFVAVSAVYTVKYGINISLIAINLYLIFITVIKKWS